MGIDIVRVGRMQPWADNPALLRRYFHPQEIAEAESRGVQQLSSLAARFAAKEAFGKALGTGLKGIRLKDIQVVNDRRGKPGFVLHGTAHKAMRQINGASIHLSLSHEKEYSVASVMIE